MRNNFLLEKNPHSRKFEKDMKNLFHYHFMADICKTFLFKNVKKLFLYQLGTDNCRTQLIGKLHNCQSFV
jgi:hypothetical protein